MSLLGWKPVQWALGLLLGAVFIHASWDKILHPAEFARIIYHYQLVGPSREIGPLPANLLAVTLPWVELLVGLLLASGLWRREAALVAAVMLLVFMVAVGAALARGIDIENCGCFTVTGAGRQASLKLIAGDLVLLAAAAALLAPRKRAPVKP